MSVQALEAMGKLSSVNGNVSTTLDKLSGVRGDLVRNEPDWDSWDSISLTDAVNQWVKRNPVLNTGGEREDKHRRKDFHSKTENRRFVPRGCVYCGDLTHKPVQCEK